MRVKICGITNLEDANNAIIAGADALGFVFYKESPRYIEPKKVKAIINQLPPFVQYVGLFVNENVDNINMMSKESGIEIAQIINESENDFCYKSLDVKYIKVIRACTKDDILKYKDEYRLIDAYVDGYGGKGKRINLDWFDNMDCSTIILAGGLSLDNLHELAKYNFYALDVSSSVEISQGKKHKDKMIEFIRKVNELYS